MVNSFKEFVSIIESNLSSQERSDGVAYAIEIPIAADTLLQLPGVCIRVSSRSHLAFIDRQPTANWGHSARYILVSLESGIIQSFEARLPPFQARGDFQWKLVYKAESVPDEAIAFPQ